jgi:putative FmdB family regulatory protein
MPTYEYKCKKCGYVFEKFQRMSDRPLDTCPKCNGSVQRLISVGAGVIFKISGLYANDYVKNNAPACGRNRPCCGREIPCENKPCE